MDTQEQKTKISAAQAAQVYAEVPGVLRKLASERKELSEKLAGAEAELAKYRLNERMSKIAGKMHEKGINGMSFDEQLEAIKEAHAKGRSLDAIEEAVEMTAPNGNFAKVANEVSGNGENQLVDYLLGSLPE